MKKTAFTLMIITLISKVTGLLREQVLAYFLGTGPLIDVYSTASIIPFTLFSFIIAGLVAGYIPIYSRIETESGEAKAKEFTSNLINILMILATLVVIIVVITTPFWVTLFASSYSGEKRELAIQFTRIMSLSVYPGFLSSIYIGYLQINNRFIVAETPGIIMNFLNIMFVALASYLGFVYIIAIGAVISDVLKYYFFPKTIKREGYRHSWKINWKDPHLMEMVRFAIPIVISIAAMDISTISDQSFAAKMLTDGGVSSMRYASLILSLVNGVIVISITTSSYRLLSRYASRKEYRLFNSTLTENISLTLLLIIPAMVGVMALAQPIIRLLFQRGNFGPESTAITSGVLYYYMPAIIGTGIGQLYKKAFYARSNTKTPIIMTIFQVVVNIGLNYILSHYFGLNGLAMATSVSSFAAGVMGFFLYRNKYGAIGFKSVAITGIKVAFASLVMGFVTVHSYNFFAQYHYILGVGVSVILSVLTYGILVVLLRIPEVMYLINKIYGKLKRR